MIQDEEQIAIEYFNALHEYEEAWAKYDTATQRNDVKREKNRRYDEFLSAKEALTRLDEKIKRKEAPPSPPRPRKTSLPGALACVVRAFLQHKPRALRATITPTSEYPDDHFFAWVRSNESETFGRATIEGYRWLESVTIFDENAGEVRVSGLPAIRKAFTRERKKLQAISQ
ncbi:hypothetical protein V1358_12545 [Pseudoalteromonas sp. YIC-656]|uniref:hypothetical protein n=1 Tax=Pseudoalteromonas pernae TaxID=3118054 RepID=UPI003241CCFE